MITDKNRAAELLKSHSYRICKSTDRMMMWVMLLQWMAGIVIASTITPTTWIGGTPQIHIHVWAATVLGALLSVVPILLALRLPGRVVTRQVIAVSQMCWAALLIHITGGRIETHFHVFGSLAFLACYRDYRVLVTATIVVAVEHFARGVWWPQSVFGVVLESPWRWVEHAGWVIFEDIFLLVAMRRSLQEAREICERQSALEATNRSIEAVVQERTSELSQAREFFRVILDSVDANICILDDGGNIVETNKNWRDFADTPNLELTEIGTGSNYVAACRNATGECRAGALAIADAIEEIIQGEREYYTDEYPCHSGDNQAWYQVRITPLRQNDRGMAVVAHIDITNRILSDLELNARTAEAQKLALVAKYTDNAVIITDDQGQIEWVNEGFTRISEYELEEVRGKVPGHFLQGEDTDPKVVRKMHDALTRSEGFDAEVLNYSKSGEPYWLAIEVRPIHNPDGEVVQFIAVESDISDRKRAIAERERLQEELLASSHKAGMAELATDILHNVGNVLNSINVSVKLVSQQVNKSSVSSLRQAADLVLQHDGQLGQFVTDDPRGKLLPSFLDQLATESCKEQGAIAEELESLAKNVEHVKEIVAVQQNYAKVSGVQEEVELSELVDDAIKAVDASLMNHGIELIREYKDAVRIVTQKHKVLQVLVNLVSNAKHAVMDSGSENQTITVRVERADGNRVSVEVIDNGVGIDPEIVSRIYEHGFTTKKNGHGFGLHGSANAAKSLGGTLRAQSDGPGCGATFRLELPVEDTRNKACQKNEMVAS